MRGKVFFEKKQKKTKFDLFKKFWKNDFLAILELCAFYIEYVNAKFKETDFRGRNNVKYFMQTQLLRFCKDTAKISSLHLLKATAKSTHFLPAKKKIPILWVTLQTNKIKKLRIYSHLLTEFLTENFFYWIIGFTNESLVYFTSINTWQRLVSSLLFINQFLACSKG